jgi:DNA-directed RNA polymerase sigma subunit (sigma70/sigma32)
MVSGFIEEYSSTILHFFPSDKNKIYKANKILKDKTNVDFEDLAEQLIKSGTETNADDIRGLLTASSCVSSDIPINVHDNKKTTIADLASIHENNQPDNEIEYKDLKTKTIRAIHELSLFEKKFLLLKGAIDYNEYKTLE